MNAERRVKHLKEILDRIGLGGGRLEMYFISSSEGQRFAEIVEEMAERIRALGPNPLRRLPLKEDGNDARVAPREGTEA